MKNRKIIIVAFMLAAVTLLGVGYAALTDSFVLTGNAVTKTDQVQNEFDSKIYLSSASAKSTTGTHVSVGADDVDSASVNSNKDTASFTVKSLALKGEKATFEFVVKSESQFDATVTANISENTNSLKDYFKVETTVDNGGALTAGGTLTITVTVELIENVTKQTEAQFVLNYGVTTA